jgi:hypothetical protein
VVRSVCRVDLSHLVFRALQMVLEPTFAAMDTCGSGARTWGSLRMSALRGARHGTCASTRCTVACAKREPKSISGMVVGVVRSACKVDLSRLDSRALQMVSESGQVRGHGVHCAYRSCVVHGMAHVPTLDARLHVLRGNVTGHLVCPIVGVLG